MKYLTSELILLWDSDYAVISFYLNICKYFLVTFSYYPTMLEINVRYIYIFFSKVCLEIPLTSSLRKQQRGAVKAK